MTRCHMVKNPKGCYLLVRFIMPSGSESVVNPNVTRSVDFRNLMVCSDSVACWSLLTLCSQKSNWFNLFADHDAMWLEIQLFGLNVCLVARFQKTGWLLSLYFIFKNSSADLFSAGNLFQFNRVMNTYSSKPEDYATSSLGSTESHVTVAPTAKLLNKLFRVLYCMNGVYKWQSLRVSNLGALVTAKWRAPVPLR